MKSISERNMWEWAGARWWKFDFHTHTPASYDFNENEKNVTPNEWLLAFMREKVDCVAVTDHDSVDWFKILQEELQEMKKNPPDGFRELVLFPGIEITTNTTDHILAIFSPETSPKDLNEFCGKLDYDQMEPDKRRSKLSNIKIVEKICKNHGLAIPAHLDESSKHHRELARDILNNPSILAVELKEPKWRCQDNLKKEIEKHCFVWGSDTHHLKKDDNLASYPGSRYAWVKMGSPTFEGLKLALMDKSVLHYDNKNPNEIAHPVIEKIEVKNAKFLGVNETFSCVFNPWMNAIIGGRGTGKSTLIEFLRSVLGKSRQNIENPDNKIYFSAEKDGLMTENTEIMVYFRKDRMRYRSIYQYNNKTQIDTKYETTPEGTWESTRCVNDIFPIHIRSQKEIFGLATNPKQLIKMVNDVLGIEYARWDQERKKLETEYIQLCKEVRNAKELIGKKKSVSEELDETNRKIELYKVSEDDPVINNYQACTRDDTDEEVNFHLTAWKEGKQTHAVKIRYNIMYDYERFQNWWNGRLVEE